MTINNTSGTAQEALQDTLRTIKLYPCEAQKMPQKPLHEPRDVCPYCKYKTEICMVFCDGHIFEVHRCRIHGDVVPMRSAVSNQR